MKGVVNFVKFLNHQPRTLNPKLPYHNPKLPKISKSETLNPKPPKGPESPGEGRPKNAARWNPRPWGKRRSPAKAKAAKDGGRGLGFRV